MIGLIEQLERLNIPIDRTLATDIFLAFFFDSLSQFVMNQNMGKMKHSLSELLNVCVTVERNFKKEEWNETIIVFQKGSASSTQPNHKGKGKFKSKEKKVNPALKPKIGVKKKQKEHNEAKEPCFHCGKLGH